MSQSELADRLSPPRHKQTISDWENGRSNLSLDRIREIGEILGVDPVVLVTLDSDDYRRAMEEAATIVEGGLEELVEELRRRSESAPATPTSPVSEEGGSGEGPHAGEGVGETE